MKIVIIGSGVIGITAAFLLQRSGHDVTVVERLDGPGLDASFANGSLLTPSMCEPWNSPGCWRVLLRSLGRSDTPLQFRFEALPTLAGWGFKFLLNSRPDVFARSALSNLRLALHSLTVMQSIREETHIEYGHVSRGSLRLFRSEGALDRASEVAAERTSEGVTSRKLSPSETIALEPALAPIASQLAGAIHYGADQIGDCYRFCVGLAEHARRLGVRFRFRTPVTLETRSGRVAAVIAGRERMVADRYVVAAGSYSAPLLRSAGLPLPVRPAKGYSVLLDAPPNAPRLAIPLVDDELHAAIVPLGAEIRVAGTAEFAGYDRTINEARIRNLMRLLQAVLPEVPFDPGMSRPWSGLRPMSADGVPIIGPTTCGNLMVSTGHGHLGWTMAAGSAQLLSDLVSGDRPSINPAPYALSRFAR